jgi:serine phosphatase RsbU (regulator of sigma subunit)/anti-sigma regulatory factor (Ser/Thr protein kinase)
MSLHAVPVSRPAALRLLVPCDLAQVRPSTGPASAFLHEHGASEDEVRACELALVEACNNAVKYAIPPSRAEAILVDVLCSENQVELRVNDNTAGFDWPREIALPDPEQENGRGLFLIHSLMDRVIYFRGQNANCLVMRKLRNPLTSQPLAAIAVPIDEAQRRLNESEQVVRDMAEELSFCYESLSAIFRCSAELGKTNNLEEFARRLLTDLAQITSADWFVLRLVFASDVQLRVFVASDPTLYTEALRLNAPDGDALPVELEAAKTREDIWFDHLNPLEETDPLWSAKAGAAGLVHPFFLGDFLVGTLTVGKSSTSSVFTAVQANVVHTFTDFLAIQIVNARFSEEQLRTRLISRELEIAKMIQRSLLPKTIPRLPGYGLAGFCESAQQVGGDFYDVLKITDDSVLLIIADVMGKGIPAAMFAAILRSLLRAVPEWMNQPAALLARVNRLLFEELSGVDMFITAQLVFVDAKSRKLTTASAGHCPVLISTEQDTVRSLSPEGLPLGILPDTAFTNHTEILPKSCRVLLYTDGLTEARNDRGEFFGQDRLVRWLKKSSLSGKNAEQLKEELAGELNDFQSNNALSDDQTFLIMAE